MNNKRINSENDKLKDEIKEIKRKVNYESITMKKLTILKVKMKDLKMK